MNKKNYIFLFIGIAFKTQSDKCNSNEQKDVILFLEYEFGLLFLNRTTFLTH